MKIEITPNASIADDIFRQTRISQAQFEINQSLDRILSSAVTAGRNLMDVIHDWFDKQGFFDVAADMRLGRAIVVCH